MAARKKNRGLGYLRRSSGRQETSLEMQLDRAIADAARKQVAFDASPEDLKYMKVQRLNSYKDLRLDDSITGANLNRPGFLALNRDALANKAYSHVFIHRRDRYGRPEDAIGMVGMEKKLLLSGITIVYSDTVSEPMERGRQYPERDLTMLLSYYESGAYLTTLVERVLATQRLLALAGFRTGGNASYGLERVLVDAQGRVLEKLVPGRRVRQEGCHVRVMPTDGPEFKVRLYILELAYQGWGFKRIAVHLNQLGIPSPHAGKIRTDQDVAHVVSGKWSHGTVREICLDPINIGLQEFGRRSEGAHRRLGAEGPRLLVDADRNDTDNPRTVMNDTSVTITAKTGIDPLIGEDRFQKIRKQTEERGKSQRGIPRTKDPARYPLSCRLVDLTDGCGALMYARKHGERPIYVCGRYMRTNGAECENNTVDGEAMLRFTLRTLRQFVDRHGNRRKFRELLLQRAQQNPQDQVQNAANQEIQLLTAKVAESKDQLTVVRRRMALEKDDARYAAIAEEFDRINGELKTAERDLAAKQLSRVDPAPRSPEADVDAAMVLVDEIRRITGDHSARAEVNPLLRKLCVWIGLSFTNVIRGEKRVVRHLLSGKMTFGDGRLPVPYTVPITGKDRMEIVGGMMEFVIIGRRLIPMARRLAR